MFHPPNAKGFQQTFRLVLIIHHNAINTTPPTAAPNICTHIPSAAVGIAPPLLVLVLLVFALVLELERDELELLVLELEPELLVEDPDAEEDDPVMVATLDKGTVVDPLKLTTTSVTPLMTVVRRPDTEKLGFRGMVVNPFPVIISSVLPPIVVK
jgi:hypothetical protein